MKFNLEQYQKYYKKGLDSLNSYDYKEARYCLLMASKYLLLAAKGSEEKLRKIRWEKGLRLKKMALDIDLKKDNKAKSLTGDDQDKENEDKKKWLITEKPDIKFDQIAGLENVKEEIRLKVIYPFDHKDAAERFKKGAGGGILLYGPPGNGKTMIAKAIATELDAYFFNIKSSDIMSKWVGEAEQNMSKLFEMAREKERSVIFFDETEALVGKRGSGSTVMDRVIPEFLSQVDGVGSGKTSILLLGATNMPWAIDKAAMRPGRFDTIIYVGLPDQDAREHILKMNLEGIPMGEKFDYLEIAKKLDGYSGADIANVCRKATDYPFQRQIRTGSETVLLVKDIYQAIEDVSPSVDDKTIKKYLNFKKG